VAIDHLVMNVRNVDTTVRWYERVLGMSRRESESTDGKPGRVALVFGNQKMNIRPITADKEDWFTARSAVAGSEDLCFLTEASPETVAAHLAHCGIPIELGPVPKAGARGTLTSIYCRDPDGNLIEISSYQ
jgi:catechol 2,3-dioxygenase-like lactoylglutathione lyase family enzyme